MQEFSKIQASAAERLRAASKSAQICNRINAKAKKQGREEEAKVFLTNAYRKYQP